MRTIFAILGSTVLSAIGWKIGEFAGMPGAVILGAIGGGVGLYYGRRLFDEHLGD